MIATAPKKILEQVLDLETCFEMYKNESTEHYFWVWCKFRKARLNDPDWVLGNHFEYKVHNLINFYTLTPCGSFMSNTSPENGFEWIIPAYWDKQYFKQKLQL